MGTLFLLYELIRQNSVYYTIFETMMESLYNNYVHSLRFKELLATFRT